jgi:hypothetical protein
MSQSPTSTPTPLSRELPTITFGEVDTTQPSPDWRAEQVPSISADDDEDAPLLPKATLVAILGFDPDLEESDE